MWTLEESLTLLAISLLIGGVVIVAYLRERIASWWRGRRR
jgi:hypothetical protein